MMVTIQGIDFADGEVIVSVGFFLAADVTKLFSESKPQYVEAYEPRKRVFERYVEAGRDWDNFVPVNCAVGGSARTARLHVHSTRSTIVPGARQGKSYKVKVLPMARIIERVHAVDGKVDKLLLNCEGSEIEIIDGTPLEVLSLCEFIFVQFHDFIPHLNVTKADVRRCLGKLKRPFEVEVTKHKWSKYNMRRRHDR